MALPELRIVRELQARKNIVTEVEVMENIIDTISKYMDVDPVNCLKRTRKRDAVYFRQLCMFFIYKNTALSLESIGRRFGGRDHTTVVYGRDTIKDYLSIKDEKVVNDITSIKKLYETFYGSTSHNKLY